MNNRKAAPRRESRRVILAHVEKEMDEPRMSESAREEDSQSGHQAGIGKAAALQRAKNSRSVRARVNVPEGGK